MTRMLPRTRGPLAGVDCPCCGHAMDLRKLAREHHLQTGMEIACDHCHGIGVVAAIHTSHVDGADSDEVSLRQKRG